MNKTLTAAAVLFAVLSSSAHADDAALAKAKKCGSCHDVNEKLVGPSFKSIAAKYAGQKDAELKNTETRLARKLREGGVGVWGVVPMPANPEVTGDEAKRLVQWVLIQK